MLFISCAPTESADTSKHTPPSPEEICDDGDPCTLQTYDAASGRCKYQRDPSCQYHPCLAVGGPLCASGVCGPGGFCVTCYSNPFPSLNELHSGEEGRGCAVGNRCVRAYCVPFTTCSSDSDCEATGQRCVYFTGAVSDNWRCVDCVEDQECGPAGRCDAGACLPKLNCDSHQDCAPGSFCDQYGQCKPAACHIGGCLLDATGSTWLPCTESGGFSKINHADGCHDWDPCTVDSCAVELGCVHTPTKTMSCGNPLWQSAVRTVVLDVFPSPTREQTS